MTNQTQTQANETVQTETKFFDLIAHGVGYLNNPRSHSKGNGLSVTVKALRGNANDKESSRFDLDVVGTEAKKVIKRLMEKFPQLSDFQAKDKPTIYIGFQASDLRAENIDVKATGAKIPTIKGRLLKVKFINCNGERLYTAPAKEDELTDTVDHSGTVEPAADTAPVAEAAQTAAEAVPQPAEVDQNAPF